MSLSTSVEEYVRRQPQFGWRRSIIRGIIRSVGFQVLFNVTVTNEHNIPDTGPGIIMMNHISLLDPILCMGAVNNRYVIPMSKIENLRNPFTGFFIRAWGAYTINRGEVDRKALVNSIELLKSGQLILIAPEGHRQRNGLVQAKDGLAYLATKSDAVIIPTAVSGAMNWMKDMTHLHRPRINVNFGRPFKFKTEGRARVQREELAAMTDEAMYQLALAIPDESLRGVYSDTSKATTQYLEFITP